MSVFVGTGLTSACERGAHPLCSGRIGFHGCPCSCHHGRTTRGECATYGCDCHEQRDRHGLPFSRRHRTTCLVTSRPA